MTDPTMPPQPAQSAVEATGGDGRTGELRGGEGRTEELSGPDLARIRHDALEAAKFVSDSRGTRVLGQDVPRLVAEVERLRALVRNVEIFGTGFVWTPSDGSRELVLHPAEVQVFIAVDQKTPIEAERDAYRAVVDAAKAWRADYKSPYGARFESDTVLVAAVDALASQPVAEIPQDVADRLRDEFTDPQRVRGIR
jgi:hypothetical protein